jgi:hypothetical protein
VAVLLRIPSWASAATVDGMGAANGTFWQGECLARCAVRSDPCTAFAVSQVRVAGQVAFVSNDRSVRKFVVEFNPTIRVD